MSVEDENINLVDKVDENVSTDILSELRIGIYNLFISYFNNLLVNNSYEHAITVATSYLDEISSNFKNILKENEED